MSLISPSVFLQLQTSRLHLAAGHAVRPHSIPDCRTPALRALVPVPESLGLPYLQQLHLLRPALQQTSLQADQTHYMT